MAKIVYFASQQQSGIKRKPNAHFNSIFYYFLEARHFKTANWTLVFRLHKNTPLCLKLIPTCQHYLIQ